MKESAGILLYRMNPGLQFFLVHPGGPFWKNKDLGAWSIPKGEISTGEDPLQRALIEFEEETGKKLSGKFMKLPAIKQKGGKIIHSWAVLGDLDPEALVCNTFELEWPPRSGKTIVVPEVDEWAWFSSREAKQRINPAQIALIEELEALLRR